RQYRLADSIRRIPRTGGERNARHRERKLWRADFGKKKGALHPRDPLPQKNPPLLQNHRQAAVGDGAARGWGRYAPDVSSERQTGGGERGGRGQIEGPAGRKLYGLRIAKDDQ